MEYNEEIENLPEDDKKYMTKEYVRRGIHAQEKDKGRALKNNTLIVVLLVLIAAIVMLFTVVKELKERDLIDGMFLQELRLEKIVN